MPFIGQDWRAPGDAWMRTEQGGWELKKLKQCQRSFTDSMGIEWINYSAGLRTRSTDSDSSVSEAMMFGPLEEFILDEIEVLYDSLQKFDCGSVVEFDEVDKLPICHPPPHCFVKTGKSKEFVGCTSMGEAFYKLELAQAVKDVRKFNYVCKVVEILVRNKLKDLSASARKILLTLVEALVLHSVETTKEKSTISLLLSEFLSGLTSGHHHCGSPKLLSDHQEQVVSLQQLLSGITIETPFDCASEDSLTFVDLPLECLRAVLKRLPNHEALLTAAQAHNALSVLVDSEHTLWNELCKFHFTDEQIEKMRQKLESQKPKKGDADFAEKPPYLKWRALYFECKKFFGLRELYADMIHICCHCKALFWKGLGHPCVNSSRAGALASSNPATSTAPSVRVTPQQFIDMLCT